MKTNARVDIRTWYNTIIQVESAMDSLDGVIGCNAESPMAEAIADVMTEYTNAVQDAHGLGTWLEWFWLECDMGKNPLRASICGGQLRDIATVEDLIKICEEAGGHP